MAEVVFDKVSKRYPDGNLAVAEFDLRIEDGDLTVLVGPSGCGKSTLLRMAAGLEEITDGELRIGGHVVNTLEARKRDVAMVFQNYALYPHMSVFENIAFPLRSRRVEKGEVRIRVERVAGLLGLTDMLRRKPRTLSGGQRQRVAMGRAIVREPQVFLMDEPLSNLDAKLRVQMRAEIARLQATLGVTMIYVTHDQVEAMTMGTTIAVMRKGELQQLGAPQYVYDHPANLFVATFIGSPAMNLLRGRIERSNGETTCILGDQRLVLAPSVFARNPDLALHLGRDIAVGVRPERLIDPPHASDTWPRLRGRVQLVEALGAEFLAHVDVPAQPVVTEEVIEVARDIDAALAQNLEREAGARTATIVARFPVPSHVAPGDFVEISVDTDQLQFFDLDTGEAVT